MLLFVVVSELYVFCTVCCDTIM